MAYKLYTTEGVFADKNVNAICNALFENLINQFSAPTLNARFGVTGTVAKIIQGEANIPVRVLPFITIDDPVYYYLYNNISSIILTNGVVGFTDHFQVITPRIYIEVWKTAPALNLVPVNGIYSQHILEIPNYIL